MEKKKQKELITHCSLNEASYKLIKACVTPHSDSPAEPALTTSENPELMFDQNRKQVKLQSLVSH